MPLKGFVFRREAAVDGAAHIGQIVPAAQRIAPVRQPERLVHGLHGAELVLQPLLEQRLCPGAAGVVVLGLVVQLEADHVLIRLHLGQQAADDPFAVGAVARVGNVHILPAAVPLRAGMGIGQDIRVFGGQPGRNGVAGRAHDHRDAVLPRTVQHAVQAGKIELAVPRLPGAPGGLRNADHIHAGLFHQPHVLFHPGDGHVFIIICCAIVQLCGVHPAIPPFYRARGFLTNTAGCAMLRKSAINCANRRLLSKV